VKSTNYKVYHSFQPPASSSLLRSHTVPTPSSSQTPSVCGTIWGEFKSQFSWMQSPSPIRHLIITQSGVMLIPRSLASYVREAVQICRSCQFTHPVTNREPSRHVARRQWFKMAALDMFLADYSATLLWTQNTPSGGRMNHECWIRLDVERIRRGLMYGSGVLTKSCRIPCSIENTSITT
jgi:hypothetical protein